MKKGSYLSLVEIAESLTGPDMCVAPEFATLMALDANLLAAIRILEFQNPELLSGNSAIPDGIEEHLLNSILILGNALRRNLSAYCTSIRRGSNLYERQEDISF